MAEMKLINVCKTYKGGVQAVKNFNLTIEDGEFMVFVGPSGCGKSTTLRMIAGLEEISDGEFYMGDKLMNDVEPKDRDLAMVFQNYALYPYLTVYDNIAFGLKMRKVKKDVIDKKVHDVSKILYLDEYLKRKPGALSGGQRQRVALGRALVRDAEAYLLDEPLSNLDAKLRTSMRVEIISLYKMLKKTFIYVTHDQVEAMTMGTKICVMDKGEIQQVGTPLEIYDHPINKFVAGFIGTPSMNFFNGKISFENDEMYLLTEFNEKIKLDKSKFDVSKLNEDKNVIVGIRGENIFIGEQGYKCSASLIEMLGSETLLHIDINNVKLVLKTSKRLNLTLNEDVYINFDLAKIHLFDSITEQSINIFKE